VGSRQDCTWILGLSGFRVLTTVLDDAAKLERRGLEVGRGTNLDRKAQVAASRESVVRRERGQEIVEERLEAHRSARAKIPGDSRRRAVMARRYPCDTRVEG
jgi:hypothetical protein